MTEKQGYSTRIKINDEITVVLCSIEKNRLIGFIHNKCGNYIHRIDHAKWDCYINFTITLEGKPNDCPFPEENQQILNFLYESMS